LNTISRMDNFLKPVDALSTLIEEKAQLLYKKIFDLPVKDLGFADFPLQYYITCHDKRKFFSVQTAAEILYRSIKHKGKAVEELVVMDYGAGLGSLFLLAKMIGCKKVVYNDIMEDMTDAATKVAAYLNIPIDIFITGDHRTTLQELKEQGIDCDIILSRNVVEHIYDLDDFYRQTSVYQPNALIYFSTTANYHNPAMQWHHKRIHSRFEAEYLPKRRKMIRTLMPQIDDTQLEQLAHATRGLAMQDFTEAVENFKRKGVLPDPNIHYTNTCDPETGLWQEHIIKIADYKRIIESKGYKLSVLPAFWDTHYSSAWKSLIGKTMNFITNSLGPKKGLATTAFIYVIAEIKN